MIEEPIILTDRLVQISDVVGLFAGTTSARGDTEGFVFTPASMMGWIGKPQISTWTYCSSTCTSEERRHILSDNELMTLVDAGILPSNAC